MTTKLSETAVAFASARGISASTLERLGAGSGTTSMPPDGRKCEVIAFPYRRGEQVVNVKMRAIGHKAFKQREGGEARFFNLDTVIGGPLETVYVAEGEFDVAALVEAGFSVEEVLSVPNGAPAEASDAPEETNRYRYVDAALAEGLGRCRRFVLVTDNDPPGRALRQDLARLIGPARCSFIDWPDGV